MAKIKYYYDTKTLSYKRIELNTFDKFKRTLSFLSASAVIGLIMVMGCGSKDSSTGVARLEKVKQEVSRNNSEQITVPQRPST